MTKILIHPIYQIPHYRSNSVWRKQY